MSQILSTLGYIVLMLVILGVLVSIHEAGHLTAAKIFKVYCFEYSLGFGPKIFRKKRKGGETAFAIRALPLGGFVSMYGEAADVQSLEDGEELPPKERSLEGVAKWKKCIILLAGVTLNFLLGLVLLFVSCSCFPQYYSAYAGPALSIDVAGTSVAQQTLVLEPTYAEGSEILSYIESNKEADYEAKDYVLILPSVTDYGYVLDSNVTLTRNGSPYNEGMVYVAVYFPNNLVSDHDLSSSLRLYPAKKENGAYVQYDSAYAKIGLTYMPDPEAMQKGEYFDISNAAEGVSFQFKPVLVPNDAELSYAETFDHKIPQTTGVTMSVENGAWKTSGINLPVIKAWLGWSGSWSKWSQLVPYSCSAIVKGFASLFTGGWGNLSGIVGMTAALPTVQATGGWANIFFYAGLISINLAFFNLLPFPGLDGWALLVTVIEGISRKKVPEKAKNIVSYVGLGLLIVLMVAITIKDIIALI